MSHSPHRARGRRARRSLAVLAVAVVALAAVLPALGLTSTPPAAAPSAADRSIAAAEARAQRAARAVAEPAVVQHANGPLRARPRSDLDRVRWRRAIALGTPGAGGLDGCVRLPAEGETFVSWDPVTRRTPNRADRRCGTARLVRAVLKVAAAYAKAHPEAPRLVVGDLSRPGGGDFGVAHGDLGDGQGHVSHENGLDVDVYYPRRDGREHGPPGGGPQDVIPFDRELAQDLVDRFVAAGAQAVFVGTDSGLTGPPAVVVPVARHNDHMHVRLGSQAAAGCGSGRACGAGRP
jgi:hypothetical protein